MSGRDAAGSTELEAAARRLAALADRLRALRGQLSGNADDGRPSTETSAPGSASEGAKDEAR